MRILEAKEQLMVRRVGGYRRFVERECLNRWGTKPNWQTKGVLPAEIVGSNWRVKCAWCADALVIERGQPFFCCNCMMVANEGKAADVVWPDDETRALIERLLMLRPDPQTRNWLPGETVLKIARENLEHGINLPEGLAYQFNVME